MSLQPNDERGRLFRQRGLLSLVILLLMAVAGCASGKATIAAHNGPAPTATSAGTPTPTATVAPLVSAPLTWQPTATLPTIQPPAYVAPSDGATAYLCDPSTDDLSGPTASGVPAQIWRTGDRGAHWQRQTDVPVSLDRNQCQIVIDATNPLVAVVVLAFRPRGGGAGSGGDPSDDLNYATEDGGVSWRLLPSLPPFSMEQLATRSNIIYALREVPQGSAIQSGLWKSTDDMRTWTPLGVKIGADLNALWLNPANNSILVQSGDDRPKSLWKSTDGGQTFTKLAITNNVGFIARIPTGASDWTICGVIYDTDPLNHQPNTLLCSVDGGATWQIRSNSSVAAIPVDDFAAWTRVFGIGADGSLFGVIGQGDTPALVRLPPGATAWIALGSTDPYASVIYGASAGSGVIWQFTSGVSTALVS